MVPLRRHLKNKVLAPLLERARGFLGPGWRVHIREAGAPPSDNCHSEELRLDGDLVGYLDCVFEASAGDARPVHDIAPVARFTADMIEHAIAGEAARRSLAAEVLAKYREVSLLHRATLGLNASLRPRDVAQALLAECHRGELSAEVGMVFLRPPGAEEFIPFFSAGDESGLDLTATAQSALFADVVRRHKGEIVNDLQRDRRWRGEANVRALLLHPLCAANRCVGMLVLGAASTVRFEANHLQYVGTLAAVAGTALGNALHFEAVQTLINSLMQALATAIDARDPYTAGHSKRVAQLGVALATVVHQDTSAFPDVHFSPHDIEELLFAGLLHDVGKIGIREEVLTKATRLPHGVMQVIAQRLALEALVSGKYDAGEFERLSRINAGDSVGREDAAFVTGLGARTIRVGNRTMPLLSEEEIACLLIVRGNLTPEERREIERHPAESYRILRHIPFPENMSRLLDIISQHHERLDGSGYPAGLKGDAILLQSRIIAIVDIYDAITMARHYKPALPREKALGILWQEAGAGRIDAKLVELLEANIDRVEADCRLLGDRLDLPAFLASRQA